MSAPLVTVIMPLHNAARFVADAVHSVLAQSMRDLELIVVDDASTDGSGEIVRSIGDSRVRKIRSDVQLNAAGARNLGLAETKSEFVAFLDADDIAARDRLEIPLSILLSDPSVGVVSSLVTPIDAQSRPCGESFVRQRQSAEIPPTLLFENCIALSSVTARRAVLRPFSPSLAPAEDYALWVQLARETKFCITPHKLVSYRVHSGGVSMRQAEAMRSAVAAIHAGQLTPLGFADTPAIHARIAAWPIDATLDQVSAAEEWLVRLRMANEECATYPPALFARILAARWFSVCLDSWSLGWPVWTLYHRSSLAAPTLARRARLLRRLLPQRFRAR